MQQAKVVEPEVVERWLSRQTRNLDRKAREDMLRKAREISGRNAGRGMGSALTLNQITGGVFQEYPGARRRFLDDHPGLDTRFRTPDLAAAIR